MANPKKILAVAETSYIIRKGLVYALSQSPVVSKVVELKEREDLIYQLNIVNPDAVIINPMLLGHSPKQDVRQQLHLTKKVPVIALVYNLIDEQFYRSYDAVIKINDSESALEEALMKCLTKPLPNAEQEELSERECDILQGIVKGMSNKEIADTYNISVHTVVTHRRNIGRKLGIHSVPGLTVYAIINKFIDIKDISI